jgi:hypothetical protein
MDELLEGSGSRRGRARTCARHLPDDFVNEDMIGLSTSLVGGETA